MERPEAEPSKLLALWMEWERGDTTPGQALANMKKGGMRELLDRLAGEHAAAPEPEGTKA